MGKVRGSVSRSRRVEEFGMLRVKTCRYTFLPGSLELASSHGPLYKVQDS
jgi:hypothetical protein